MSEPRRIAMWSGPRNISTAMMRSWGNRADTFACDEPLYAHYLRTTGLEHPGRDEVLASQDNDWRRVAAFLTGPVPGDKPVFYQKHMAHHLLPNIGRHWLDQLTNAFLIRDPREMLTSLIKVTPNAGFADTGLTQQWEMFRRVSLRTGRTPVVIDSRDVLDNPRGVLPALCNALDVPFDDAMLSWEPGPRETDGVWARHWYTAVEKSTGFAPYQPKNEVVPERLAATLEECNAIYQRLYEHRIEA